MMGPFRGSVSAISKGIPMRVSSENTKLSLRVETVAGREKKNRFGRQLLVMNGACHRPSGEKSEG